MKINELSKCMAANAERIQDLVSGISLEQARWKPAPDSWSILEVINHLYDEEKLDFRVRLKIILTEPSRPWPPIDPEGWVVQRKYNERDLADSTQNFLAEREVSLQWIRGLEKPDWEKAYEASFGPIKAGDMMAAWIAHDLLHMRQLVELHWALTDRMVTPYRTIYAGQW
jgi:hypothetical protein